MPAAEEPQAGVCAEVLALSYPSPRVGLLKAPFRRCGAISSRTSAQGQSRRIGRGPTTSGLPFIHDALAVSKTPMTAPTAPATPPAVDLDSAQIEQIIGVKGQANGGVLQFNLPRRDAVIMEGMRMAPVGPMGVAEAINFQPTGSGKAAITGDFVLTDTEVNPVLKTLRSNGIDVTALHSHMLIENPRLFFMHFWANDDAIKLAKGVRAALDKAATTRN
jgi:hypothetical protein